MTLPFNCNKAFIHRVLSLDLRRLRAAVGFSAQAVQTSLPMSVKVALLHSWPMSVKVAPLHSWPTLVNVAPLHSRFQLSPLHSNMPGGNVDQQVFCQLWNQTIQRKWKFCRKVLALVSILLQIMKCNLMSGDYTIWIGDSKYPNEKWYLTSFDWTTLCSCL